MAKLQHQALNEPPLSRRGFLIGMVGAGLAFGFAPAEALSEASSGSAKGFEPTIWYSIDGDGVVTVNIIRAEMGQHIGTALARILADELEADWAKVRIDAVDTDPKWGVMMTGGSNSVWATFPIFSRAGAAGRIALIEEGAKLLGVPAQQCLARNGAVVAGNRSVSFGDIVKHGGLRRTFTPDELAQLPIKPASERRLIGRNTDAIDIPAKTNGTARYGIDATIDGMVYARPKIPPDAQWCTRALDRRFRGQEGQGLYQQPRARGPLQYGSGLGDGVRELLSGGDQRGRPCQGRLVGRRRREDFRAGHPRSWRETDRRAERRQPAWWTIRA